jgi:hypothetical protein
MAREELASSFSLAASLPPQAGGYRFGVRFENREIFFRVQHALDQFIAVLTSSRTPGVSTPALLLK